MLDAKFNVGDVVRMKKAHPCGSFEWEITRTGRQSFLIKNIERERRKMQITALDHLVLTTSNFELCVWFYRDVLGMELLCQNDHYAFRFGMQKINVHRCPAEFLPAAGNVAYGSLDICLLTVTELPIVYQELACLLYTSDAADE